MTRSPEHPPICVPKLPSNSAWVALARQAHAINPDNLPPGVDLDTLAPAENGRLAIDVRLRWPKAGKRFTVTFLDDPPQALRDKILRYMNKWSLRANVSFVASDVDADVRIARLPGDGHWSWLGVDILNHHGPGEATMNLDSFTLNTPDSEFDRVVCHEAGHTLGFPHEHLRAELIARLDPEETIAYYRRTQGWTRNDVIFQLLTPLAESSILATPRADERSIMCYDVPAECTRDGVPIIGGVRIEEADHDFIATVYPKPSTAA